MDIELDAIDTYYYAVSHRPVVRSLTIRNSGPEPAVGDLLVRIFVAGGTATPLLHERIFDVPAPAPGDAQAFRAIRIEPNHRELALLDEQLTADLTVEVSSGSTIVGVHRQPITFLAYNQWMHRLEFIDSYAAFVMPNHPMLSSVMDRTRTLLGERTGNSGSDGYQSADPVRIEAIARATFDALSERRLNYANPPSGFEGYGQKIRTPDIVFQDNCATCLDSSVLYASCLAAAGLDPVLVLSTGHAFAGYWTRSESARRPVIDNRNDIADLVANGAVQVVETTAITGGAAGHGSGTFDVAVGAAGSIITDRLTEVEALVDVAAARAAGVRPVPFRRIVDGILEIETPAATILHVSPPSSVPDSAEAIDEAAPPGDARRLGAFEAPPRIRAWLKSLLDLSFANPLISLKAGRGTFRFDLPPGMLAGLEDRVMGSDTWIELVSAAKVPARLLDEPSLDDALTADFASTGRIYFPNVSTLEATIEVDARRTIELDPSIPSPIARRAAEVAVAAEMQQQLDASIVALRRKAREIESQTGSNNLFLTIGALQWTEPATPGVRRREGTATAPLFLIPVRITGSANSTYRISADDGVEVTPNYCMLEKLRQTFGIVIPELETPDLDGSGIDVSATLAAVRRALGDRRINDVIVQESAHLAVLNFATFRLWKDMRDHWQQFIQNDVVRHLVESPYEAFENAATPKPPSGTPGENSGETQIGETQIGETRIGELLCPIEIDESQLEAVTWAVQGRSFVIEGPPGTGKSQTITNLLAACIAADKRVLFVAQKQPALQVVKKRLEQIGLTPFCIDLHDKGSKPEQIRTQVRDALDFTAMDREAEWTDVSARLAADDQALSAYRSVIHSPNAAGYSAWSAEQELTELGPGPAAEVPPSFLADAPARLIGVRDALLALPAVASSVRREPGGPWSLAAAVDFSEIDQAGLNTLVRAMQATLDALATSPAAVKQALARVQEPADLDVVMATLEAAAAGTLPDDSELAGIGTPTWRTTRDAARERLQVFQTAVAPLLEEFAESVFSADLRVVVRAGIDAMSAGFLTRGRRERTFRALLLPFTRPIGAPPRTTRELAALVQQVESMRTEASTTTAQLVAVAGVRLSLGWSALRAADVDSVIGQLSDLEQAASVFRSPLSTAVRSALDGGWLPAPTAVAELTAARTQWQQLGSILGASSASLQRWRNGRGLFEAWAASNPAWIGAGPRFLELQRWTELVATLQPLADAAMSEFVAGILDGRFDIDTAYDQFRRGLVGVALDERLESGRVDQFDGLAHDRRVENFIGRTAQRRQLMRTVIPEQLTRRRPFGPGARFGEYGALERELSKTTRRLSIRKLIERYGEILPTMTPCFLMSPDSVARFIPPGSITFDLVVFDEASQIEVAEAIGAMGRAKAVVVVGDSRQMPPSKFGGGAAGSDSTELASSELDDGAETSEIVFEDLESILSECVESNLPRLYLRCHYRSRHEALIAFSNAAFYDGKLTTFPSPFTDGPPPIHWRRIDGQFDRSGAGEAFRTNRAEAVAIVDDIVRRLNDPAISSQSICVVTLNVQQQGLVVQLLEQVADDRIKALMDDETDHGLIVRNLESVQGDERDVVLISVAFAPITRTGTDGSRSRRLPLNFGPLNRRGGERRLNVAVTRARCEVTVFCSFDPEEMQLAETPAKGIELLKQYLSIARDGTSNSSTGTSGDLVAREPTAPDHHRAEIAGALRRRGLRVRENVGLSKFRIDIAVGVVGAVDWDVAILLDGPGWAARSTVYDRDALPPNVLTIMGWPRIVRVWLPSWIQEPQRVLDQIAAAVEAANAVPPPLPSPTSPVRTGPPLAPIATEIVPPIPAPAASRLIAELEQLFVAASTTIAGDREILHTLDDPAAAARVSSVIAEVMMTEAPVHAARLAKIVMTRFGFERATPKRTGQIIDLAIEAQLRRTSSGIFLWSSGVDVDSWRQYRRTPNGIERKLEHIAPEEITNAMTDIVGMSHTIDRDELFTVVGVIFGVHKLTPAIRAHLEPVLTAAVASGRLLNDAGRVRVSRA